MEKGFEIRKEKQEKIPAVCHIDGTGDFSQWIRKSHLDITD